MLIVFATSFLNTDDARGYLIEWVYSGLDIFNKFLNNIRKNETFKSVAN